MNHLYSFLLFINIRNHRSLRILLRSVALVGGLIAAFIASMLMELGQFGWATFVFVPVLLTAFLDFVVVEFLVVRAFPIETEQKLIQMEKQLGSDAIQKISDRLQQAISRFAACDQSRISGTVHVLVELSTKTELQVKEGLLQLTDYVGPEGGKKGRLTTISQGVIGRCARTQEMEHVDFANASEYSERMVREFGFTQSETERHTKNARSYLAYPLFYEDQRLNVKKFVGVLYFFTTEPQVFPIVADNADLRELSREVVNYMSLAKLV